MKFLLLFCVCIVVISAAVDNDNDNRDNVNFKEQISLLSKQVSALLNKRREDFELMEENISKNLLKSDDIVAMKQEIEDLK